MINYLLYIFDLDGTIINSERSIIESLKHTAKVMRCPEPGLEEAKTLIGQPLDRILTAMGVKDIGRGRDIYREHYYEWIMEEKPYPGMKKLIRTLHNRVKLTICTNKGLNGAKVTLENNDLLSYFDTLSTASDGVSKPDVRVWQNIQVFYQKQHIRLEAADCLMVGDSPTDAAFAANCGMDYAHVDWGFYDLSHLDHEPRYRISRPGQLLEILSEPENMILGPELDLHGFNASEQMKVVQSYLDEVKQKGWKRVRIIHGKGKGVQRQNLHRLLDQRVDVISYRLEPGNMGATLISLKIDD